MMSGTNRVGNKARIFGICVHIKQRMTNIWLQIKVLAEEMDRFHIYFLLSQRIWRCQRAVDVPLRLGFEAGLGDALQTVIYLRVFRFRYKKKVLKDGTRQFSIYIMVFDLNFGLCSAVGTMAIKYKCPLFKYFEQIRSYINSPSMRQWLDKKIP